MKFFKALLFISFLSPVFLVTATSTNHKSDRILYPIVELESIELDGMELMFDHQLVKEVSGVVDYTRLFTYQEALDMQSSERRLPNENELKEFLLNAGFNSDGPFGLIPDEYYDLSLEYPGIVDPILGHVNREERLGLWFKGNEKGQNYISIERDELTFYVGKALPQTKMSLRYLIEK